MHISKQIAVAAIAAFSLVAVPARAATEQDEFLEAISQISPKSADVLRTLGRDYARKCGAEPTVAQYKMLSTDSEAFVYRMALEDVGQSDESQWSDDVRGRYEKMVEELNCDAAG